MASVGIRCQGNCHFLNLRGPENSPVGPCSVAISAGSDSSKLKRWRMKAAMTIKKNENMISTSDSAAANAAVVYEKLDEWMKDSVVEIVKNLREAPLLVQVYDKGETTALKTEKAVEEETWSTVKEKWGKRETPLPEGVIFVEQLDEEDPEEITTRAWGIVVQGKGVDCGPVCYLLKTSRVGSGLGAFCTHFCLMKVKSFRESTRSQLKNFWLLEGQ
ncbi:hypothetical protein JCGZ_03320 [Jatropha curcas]|uniref:DUF7804 domain-containing protein n=1 Tax=Jatropha curcas TaxID=180498 RepID=A0A067JQ58_JATCU|nr:uncharacterized protein LOC105649179 [Jatropha curcas]KDP21649.1 hypothetical protein JCGZ_03320 [Jatropha curcas]